MASGPCNMCCNIMPQSGEDTETCAVARGLGRWHGKEEPARLGDLYICQVVIIGDECIDPISRFCDHDPVNVEGLYARSKNPGRQWSDGPSETPSIFMVPCTSSWSRAHS
jgi:hypothetical protein